MNNPLGFNGAKIDLDGRECLIQPATYEKGGRTALLLIDAQTGKMITCLTANIPALPLEPGCALIRDHGEHDGMAEMLEQAGVVKKTGHYVESGFVRIPICKVTLPERELEKDYKQPHKPLREFLGTEDLER